MKRKIAYIESWSAEADAEAVGSFGHMGCSSRKNWVCKVITVVMVPISNVNHIETKRNKALILAFLNIEAKQTLLIPKF
jgi:hypothetical protein